VLRWAREQDPPCLWNNSTFHEARVSGCAELFQYVLDNGCPRENPIVEEAVWDESDDEGDESDEESNEESDDDSEGQE